jgi:DNA polymerase-3 subunit gamma/tau
VARLPLARRYRPQRFEDVVGQEAIVRALSAAARNASVSSSYVFSGTRGVGKTTIARIFAKALNCESGPAADCCDRCQPCVEIREGRCLDVLEMDAATHTGIDDIRELRQAAQYPPSRDRYRVFILDEAHQLSSAAWNGLLKVLEEPPAWCLFIFCTTEPHKIPPTIESRSLHFAFRSPAPSLLRKHLEKIAGEEDLSIAPEALDLLVGAADGSVRDGMSAMDQVRAATPGAIDEAAVREALGLVSAAAVDRYLDALLAGDAPAALQVVEALDEEGQDLRAFVAEALEAARRRAIDAALGQGGGAPIESLVWTGRVLDQTEARLRQGGPQRTLLDLATLRIAKLSDLTPLEDLASKLEGGGATGGARGGGGGPRPQRAAPRGGPGAQPKPADASPPGPASEPPPPPSHTEAGPASPAPGGEGDLLQALVGAIRNHKSTAAAYLSKATAAELRPDGTLAIMMEPAQQLWVEKLRQGSGAEALERAATEVLGRSPTGISLEQTSKGNGRTEGPARPNREEALSRARQDPLVRSLFNRFGAVVLDGQPVDPEDGSDRGPQATDPA